MRKIIISSVYYHQSLNAEVHVVVRSTARRITARWKGYKLYVTVPKGVTIEEYDAALEHMMPQLTALRDKAREDVQFHYGQRLEWADYAINIVCGTKDNNHLDATIGKTEATIILGRRIDLNGPTASTSISKMISRILGRVAAPLLLPRAQEIADSLGLKPRTIILSRGHRTLGRCSAKGEIALSSALVMYPRRLRDYVVCHELAHLSEMNHSARFHALCDSYCRAILGECEKPLEREFKHYKTPIVR